MFRPIRRKSERVSCSIFPGHRAASPPAARVAVASPSPTSIASRGLIANCKANCLHRQQTRIPQNSRVCRRDRHCSFFRRRSVRWKKEFPAGSPPTGAVSPFKSASSDRLGIIGCRFRSQRVRRQSFVPSHPASPSARDHGRRPVCRDSRRHFL